MSVSGCGSYPLFGFGGGIEDPERDHRRVKGFGAGSLTRFVAGFDRRWPVCAGRDAATCRRAARGAIVRGDRAVFAAAQQVVECAGDGGLVGVVCAALGDAAAGFAPGEVGERPVTIGLWVHSALTHPSGVRTNT